jgi:hypothetical protein
MNNRFVDVSKLEFPGTKLNSRLSRFVRTTGSSFRKPQPVFARRNYSSSRDRSNRLQMRQIRRRKRLYESCVKNSS